MNDLRTSYFSLIPHTYGLRLCFKIMHQTQLANTISHKRLSFSSFLFHFLKPYVSEFPYFRYFCEDLSTTENILHSWLSIIGLCRHQVFPVHASDRLKTSEKRC